MWPNDPIWYNGDEREGLQRKWLSVGKGKEKYVPINDGKFHPPKVKIKVVDGRKVVKIKFWKTIRTAEHVAVCFGLESPQDVGDVLANLDLTSYIEKPTVQRVQWVLKYLYQLRPINLLAAQRALHALWINEHCGILQKRMKAAQNAAEHKAWSDEYVKLMKLCDRITR